MRASLRLLLSLALALFILGSKLTMAFFLVTSSPHQLLLFPTFDALSVEAATTLQRCMELAITKVSNSSIVLHMDVVIQETGLVLQLGQLSEQTWPTTCVTFVLVGTLLEELSTVKLDEILVESFTNHFFIDGLEGSNVTELQTVANVVIQKAPLIAYVDDSTSALAVSELCFIVGSSVLVLVAVVASITMWSHKKKAATKSDTKLEHVNIPVVAVQQSGPPQQEARSREVEECVVPIPDFSKRFIVQRTVVPKTSTTPLNVDQQEHPDELLTEWKNGFLNLVIGDWYHSNSFVERETSSHDGQSSVSVESSSGWTSGNSLSEGSVDLLLLDEEKDEAAVPRTRSI